MDCQLSKLLLLSEEGLVYTLTEVSFDEDASFKPSGDIAIW